MTILIGSNNFAKYPYYELPSNTVMISKMCLFILKIAFVGLSVMWLYQGLDGYAWNPLISSY